METKKEKIEETKVESSEVKVEPTASDEPEPKAEETKVDPTVKVEPEAKTKIEPPKEKTKKEEKAEKAALKAKAEKEAKNAKRRAADKARREKKKAGTKVKVEPTPKKIRMLMSAANSEKTFGRGGVFKVGVDVSPGTARSWLRTGVAEEDCSEVPPETK